jgi:uncharacterized membrane protein
MQLRLQQRVAASELCHTGEILFYVEATLPLSYLWRDAPVSHITRQRALAMFGKLRVWDTANNNGVLIYLLLAERSIEIVADRGLNQKVDPQHWEELVSRMRLAFKDGNFQAGLTQALEEVTALLEAHFPLKPGYANPNELPDSPVLAG